MINITFLNTLLFNCIMWYTPIECKAVEHAKQTIAQLDVIIQRQERAKRFLGLVKTASYVHMTAGGLLAAIAPINACIQYNSIGFKEIAAAIGISLTGLVMSYFGRRNIKWARDEEKIAQERQNELLDERIEFLEMKKENEKSPAYQALVN